VNIARELFLRSADVGNVRADMLLRCEIYCIERSALESSDVESSCQRPTKKISAQGGALWYLGVEEEFLFSEENEQNMNDVKAIEFFKSGEVIKKSGVSRQVLYQYTTMGLVEEARRTEHGHRLYDKEVFQRLRIIRELNASGYPLKDIKEIFFSDKKLKTESV
jgi:hypothetical protein